MVVVFLLRGLHNEAGNTKFRNVRQYIAHMGHVGGKDIMGGDTFICPKTDMTSSG